MSASSERLLFRIAHLYAVDGRPDHKRWNFDAGRTSEAHLELASLAMLVKFLGTPRG